ncbi:DUF2232 domain-containing protein [Gorillibacterium sp. sgz5001074]|uniref:DUF2232 domain-containing protein n=1 Tax=Gorillibacterium sp. sgz5001074 TaxID=3446695 RepID=UPI003F669B84
MSKGRSFALVWCIINLLMLLSFITPLVIISLNFIMVPAVVLYARLDLKRFILFYAISLAGVCAITGYSGLVLAIMSLFFLAPAIMMGRMYKKQAPARVSIVAGAGTLLAEFLLGLLVSYAAGYRPMDQVKDFIRDSVDSLPDVLRNSVNEAALDLAIHYFMQIIPLLLIAASLFYTVIAHGIGRWVLRRNGMQVPGLPPMREWRLPKSMAFYLIIVTIFDLFISIESNSFLSMVVWNLLPILTAAFAIQAIGFLFFVAHAKKWSVALPVVAIVLAVVLPFLMYFYCLLGVLDVLLPIRKRITG